MKTSYEKDSGQTNQELEKGGEDCKARPSQRGGLYGMSISEGRTAEHTHLREED